MSRAFLAAMWRGRRRAEREESPEIADEVLARAEAVIDALSAEYPEHAMRDIERLVALTERMAGGPVTARDLSEISRIAHDMRGQGTLFGFPLMTRCAASLCRATRTLERDNRALPGVVQTHVAALYAVLSSGSGPGDPGAVTVAKGLELLVDASRRR